jgi:hypothetical protein
MSPTKKRQTMGKITRERERRERRALKQERKDEKRAAAAEGATNAAEGSGEEAPADEAATG